MEVFDYPDSMVFQPDRAIGYFTAMLRAGVSTIREMLNKSEYLELLGYDDIPVDMEAPMEDQKYPYVHVMYRNRGMQPASLEQYNHVVYEVDGVTREDDFSIWEFDGEYIINIYAVTILEREKIADVIIGALAIDPRFKKLLIDNPYIGISPNLATFDSMTSNESWGTPWSSDLMTAYRQFTFAVNGEFVWRVASPAQFISNIEVSAIMSGL